MKKMNYKFKTKPFAHQKKALEDSYDKEFYALFMEMGTGKTKVALDTMALLFEENKSPLPVFIIERGGEVTHHMPGQIVGYLVLNLSLHKKDLSWYLRELEQVLIDVLDLLGMEGKRINGLTGVWCEDKKVGSIGIGCKRWVTQHGFSLNVDCDLMGFEKIIPCGLDKVKLGKLSDWIPGIKVCDVKPLLRESVKRRFKLNWEKIN